MSVRIDQLEAAGMVFDKVPSAEVESRIAALSDEEFGWLLATTPKLSTPKTGPSLRYQNGGFQLRSGG